MSNQLTTRAAISAEIDELFEREKSLAKLEAELMQNEQFRSFLNYQKEIQEKIKDTWDRISRQMIAHNVKSIKGEWGVITVAEKLDWDVSTAELPKKFYKKVVDTKRLSDTYRLEGKAPKGAIPSIKKYLTKRIK